MCVCGFCEFGTWQPGDGREHVRVDRLKDILESILVEGAPSIHTFEKYVNLLINLHCGMHFPEVCVCVCEMCVCP